MSTSNGSLPPSTTLYVKNISSKIKKVELKRQLYCLFISYGKVLDVVQMRRSELRGQAHVVFRDLASSTAALRALDGFIFYEKPLNISYANGKSKATLIAERGPEALFDPDLLSTKSNTKKTTFSSAGAELQGRERKRAREEAGVKVVNSDVDSEEEDEEEEKEEKEDGSPEVKKAKLDNEANDEEEEMQMADSDDDA